MKSEFSSTIRRLKRFRDLGSEDLFQDGDRQQKSRMRGYPSASVRSEASGRNDAVDMRMMFELLVPGVKHTEESDVGSESLRIPGDFDKSLGAGPEQNVVNNFLVLQRQRSELMGEREDNMRIRDRKQIA